MTIQPHPSSDCPSCGQFVGPYARCPYCGADIGQRVAVRVLKVGSLVLSIGGLAILLFVAARSEVPVAKVGNLGGTMNWAYVRIEGVVARQPSYDPAARSLKFWVWDETGEIMVAVYHPQADALLAGGMMPVMGDSVALEGTLRIREDFAYLVLDLAQELEVQPNEPVEMAIADVDGGLLRHKVRVKGVIRDDRNPYEGLRILSLRDATGEIDVTILPETLAFGGAAPDLHVGQPLQVTGAVDLYKGTPQIAVGRGSDLLVLDEPMDIAPLLRTGKLAVSDVERLVRVEGVISAVDPFSSGVKFRLDDGSGAVTMLVWQDLYDSLTERGSLSAGAALRVQGVVTEYRGELEIVPQLPADIEVIIPDDVASASLTLAIEPTVGMLDASDTENASVALLLEPTPGSTAQPTPGSTAEPGSESTAQPTTEEHKDPTPEPAVLPTSGPTTAATPTRSIEPRAVGAISRNDTGSTFTIVQASIGEVDYFSRGVKYRLSDGTGTIILLAWQDVLEEIPDRYDLFAGSQVQVTGAIEEYEGDLEIIPRTGADVVLLRRGERLPIEARAVNHVTASDEGRIFTIEGTVARIESSGWLRMWLNDGTGEMLVFVPERTVPYLPSAIGNGVWLRVTGEVDIYRGVVEIIPLAGADVEVP